MIALKNQNDLEQFVVVHPLFDKPEQKCDASELGQMTMSPTVRFCLLTLRVYLIGMGLLLGYHLLDLAGALHHLPK